MTSLEYKNVANTFPLVAYVIPLYVTDFNIELPKTLFLLTVVKIWALFVEDIEHELYIWPIEKGK